MKTSLRLLVLATALTAVVTSCKKDVKNPEPKAEFSVTPTSLTFAAEPEGTKEIAVTAKNLTWDAKVNTEAAGWLTIDEQDGKIVVSAAKYDSYDEPRTGTVTVTPDNKDFEPVTVEVKQTELDALPTEFSVNSDPLTFAAEPEGAQEIAVTAENVEWSVSVNAESEDWLSAEKQDGKIVVSVSAYDSYDEPRTGTITVTPDSEDLEPVTIEVEQTPLDAPRIDLPEPANSHIVAPGESVYLAVDRAYTVWREYLDTELAGAPEAEVVWESSAGLIADLEFVGGYTGSEAILHATTAPAMSGNAAIGYSVDGQIRWTWHIWVTDAKMATVTATSGTKFMDRNLGAMTTGGISTNEADLNKRSWGLYYQWGRPQPVLWADQAYFAAPDSDTEQTSLAVAIPLYDENGIEISYIDSYIANEAGLAGAITNPLAYLSVWNGADGDNSWQKDGAKTIFDPCPAGWRVPVSSVWVAGDYASSSKKLSGTNIRGAALNDSWFPGAGKYQHTLLCAKDGALILEDSPVGVAVDTAGTAWNYWFADLSTEQGNPYTMYLGGFGSANFTNTSNARNVAQQIRCVEDLKK